MARWKAKYLDEIRSHAVEANRFFSNGVKPERERSVCRAFLRTVGIPFSDTEIVTSTEEPVDVIFRTARFQIREVMENRRRRGDEFRRMSNAVSINDLFEKYVPPKPMLLAELVPMLARALMSKAKRYGLLQCQTLDALVYVNLSKRYLDRLSPIPPLNCLQTQNWRSVSVVFPPFGVVLHACPGAPNFLQSVVAMVLNNWEQIDDLFDQ